MRTGGSIGVWLAEFWGSAGGTGVGVIPGDLGASMPSGTTGIGDMVAGQASDGGEGSLM